MKNRGFTLIELLVVVAIISLLSSVVMVSVEGARNKAKVARLKEDFIQVRNAAELYKSDTGNYPTTISDLVPKYLAKAPSNPFYTPGTFAVNFINTTYAAITAPGGGITVGGGGLGGFATQNTSAYSIGVANSSVSYCATALDPSQAETGRFFISSYPSSVGLKNVSLFTKFRVTAESCTFSPCTPAKIYNTGTTIYPCLD